MADFVLLLIYEFLYYQNKAAQPLGRAVKSYALPIIIMRLICAVAMAIKLSFLIIPLLCLDDKKKRNSTVILLTRNCSTCVFALIMAVLLYIRFTNDSTIELILSTRIYSTSTLIRCNQMFHSSEKQGKVGKKPP